jgi:hypothetical protein
MKIQKFRLPDGPGLGLEPVEPELEKRMQIWKG